MDELNFRGELPRINAMYLPKTLERLFKSLGFKADSTGLKHFGNLPLPKRSGSKSLRALPRIYTTSESYHLKQLFSRQSTKVMTMNLGQAVSFIVTLVKKNPYARNAHTMWVPFKDHELRGVFRLYRRENGTTELFLYSAEDPDLWAHGEDYLVAYHQW